MKQGLPNTSASALIIWMSTTDANNFAGIRLREDVLPDPAPERHLAKSVACPCKLSWCHVELTPHLPVYGAALPQRQGNILTLTLGHLVIASQTGIIALVRRVRSSALNS